VTLILGSFSYLQPHLDPFQDAQGVPKPHFGNVSISGRPIYINARSRSRVRAWTHRFISCILGNYYDAIQLISTRSVHVPFLNSNRQKLMSVADFDFFFLTGLHIANNESSPPPGDCPAPLQGRWWWCCFHWPLQPTLST